MGELIFTIAYGGALIVIGFFTKYALKAESKKANNKINLNIEIKKSAKGG